MKFVGKAILLNRINYSESSLIITYYTQQNGIQKYLFQGGKKKATNLFPLALTEITYYTRNDSYLGKITASETSTLLSEIPFDPVKSTIAFFIAEILHKCLQTEENEPLLFEFLTQSICELDKSDDVSIFPVKFLLDFSEYLGIKPHVIGENPTIFNLMEGTISNQKHEGDIYASGDVVKFIINCINKDEKIDKPFRKEALNVLIQYFQLHIPQFKTLKTLDVIKEVLY